MGKQVDKQKLFTLSAGKELVFEYFSGTGPGGQKRNKTQNCVRLKHADSGVTVQATEERSRTRNERRALYRLVESKRFMAWVRIQAAMILQGFRSLADKVDKMLKDPKQTKVEYLTTFICDGCGKRERMISQSEFPYAAPNGWKTVTSSSYSEHFCPECQDGV